LKRGAGILPALPRTVSNAWKMILPKSDPQRHTSKSKNNKNLWLTLLLFSQRPLSGAIFSNGLEKKFRSLENGPEDRSTFQT
jgi:hypothetical protein